MEPVAGSGVEPRDPDAGSADLVELLLALEVALASANPVLGDGRPLAALLADDFAEFGGSGRHWTVDAMRAALSDAPPLDAVELLDFTVSLLAPDVALATYRLGPPRPSNRSSVWVCRDGQWQVRFHQGTLTTG